MTTPAVGTPVGPVEPESAGPGRPAERGGLPAGDRDSTGLRNGLRWQWGRWRIPVALIAVVIIGGIVLAHVGPRQIRDNVYLDPASNSMVGSQALADILGERGLDVTPVYSTADALAAIGSGGSASQPTTLVITAADLLPRRELAMLSRARADLLLVQPSAGALLVLAPRATAVNQNALTGMPLPPGCTLAAARLAGPADLGGITFAVSGRHVGCYQVGGEPSLVQYTSPADRTITILGNGTPLTNGFLSDQGNAALMINLLSSHQRIVWLTAQPRQVGALPPAGSQPGQGPTLIPWAAWLVVFQLAVATLLAAIWRARRFGPLIAERLPVVIRASETVEGHARLYQSRRARDRAAQALRAAMLARILPALGVPRSAEPTAVTEALASRSRLSPQDVTALLYGPAPATDADLVALTRDLDELEREVRSQ
jgi:hypothetical protein